MSNCKTKTKDLESSLKNLYFVFYSYFHHVTPKQTVGELSHEVIRPLISGPFTVQSYLCGLEKTAVREFLNSYFFLKGNIAANIKKESTAGLLL